MKITRKKVTTPKRKLKGHIPSIYVSGGMTGLPEWNYPEFNRVSKKLREWGATVFNPAEIQGGDTSLSRSYYMRLDIEALMKCDTIVMLKGWEKSKGARLELEIAKEMEMAVLDENLNPLKPRTICEEADYLVSEDRGNSYGHPYDDFSRTGILWQGVLQDWARTTKGNEPVPARLVGLCMVGLKMSREVHKPKRDNRVDGAGYFKTVDMIETHKE